MSRSTDDATSRAREAANNLELAVGNACSYLATEPDVYLELRKSAGAAIDVLRGKNTGLTIIDTRTHAAVPREPSEALVERVAAIMYQVHARAAISVDECDDATAAELAQYTSEEIHLAIVRSASREWRLFEPFARAAIAAVTEGG